MDFFSKFLGKPSKHSIETFRYSTVSTLHQELLALSPVSHKNKEKVVENIRAITEEIIWSEQNKGDFFKYFLRRYSIECNLFRLFWNFLNDTKIKEVQVQLMQTATMFIHNLTSQESKSKKNIEQLLNTLFYRDIVCFDFDFSDEEVVEIYLSMLKTFAINLKPEMFSEFVSVNSFSLLTGAITFMNYHDSMIKTASRTVILSIFSCKLQVVRSKSIKTFIKNSGFFPMFVSSISEKLAMCDRLIQSNNPGKLETVLSEVSEDLYYANDILELKIKEMTETLGSVLIKSLIFPVAVSSLGSVLRSSYHVSIPLAGNFLNHLLRIIKNQQVVNATIIGLVCKEIPVELVELLEENPSPNLHQDEHYLEKVNKFLDYLEGLTIYKNLRENPVPFEFFSFLTSKDNNLIGTTLILLNTIMTCPVASNNLLFSAGLIPFERLKIKKLVNTLVSNEELTNSYNHSAIQSLLDLLSHEHPLQLFLFRLTCKVLVSLTFQKDSKNSLSRVHLKVLNKAFKKSIENLQDYLLEVSDYDNFFIVFENEWKNLSLPEQKLSNLVHLLLPYNEDLLTAPLEFREPQDETESLSCEIQRLLMIWQVKLSLSSEPLTSLKVYPLYNLSNAQVVEKDKSYHMQNKNLVKCCIKLKKNEENYFYASDPDFILFVKPDPKYEEFYIVKFCQSLLHIETIQDRSDPRRLVLLVNYSDDPFEIIFNDTQQCLWTLREINASKASCKERYIELLNRLFKQLLVNSN
jgi:hypothetical protein